MSRKLVSRGIGGFLLLLGTTIVADASDWQSSITPRTDAITDTVVLGIRDKYGTSGGYVTLFVVRADEGDPDAQEWSTQRMVYYDAWGFATFPTDFNVRLFPARDLFGSFTWQEIVNGTIVAKGAFTLP